MSNNKPVKKTSQFVEHTRSEVIRDTLVLQFKLLVDGFRDLMLMPLVLIASIFGLLKHQNNPGRYLYRLLNYGKATEKWIGLFDEAAKDQKAPLEFKSGKFDDVLQKTQTAFESSYIDDSKKQQFMDKLNIALTEINNKLSPEKKQDSP